MKSVESCRRRHKDNPLRLIKLGVQVNGKTNYEPGFPHSIGRSMNFRTEKRETARDCTP